MSSCPVSAWNSGRHLENGKGYGIRLGKYRDQMVDRSHETVELELVGGHTTYNITVKLTAGFWKRCPELRHPKIGKWFGELGLQRWPKRKPHKFTMSSLDKRRFRVTYSLGESKL